MFESWEVAEILKARANLGTSDPVWFYRDQSSVEIDLVIETGDRLLLVEVKSGERVASDAIEPMRAMVATFGKTQRKVQGMIVHGGDTAASVHGIELVPWRELGAQQFCRGQMRGREGSCSACRAGCALSPDCAAPATGRRS